MSLTAPPWPDVFARVAALPRMRSIWAGKSSQVQPEQTRVIGVVLPGWASFSVQFQRIALEATSSHHLNQPLRNARCTPLTNISTLTL